MKMLKIIGVFLLIIGFATGISSCKKKDPTVASITVVDTNGDRISKAFVRLYGTSTTDPQRQNILDDTLYTNIDGEATFDYTDYFKLGQAGFAVLDITVTSDTYVGTGIIKIEEEKMNMETVIIQ